MNLKRDEKGRITGEVLDTMGYGPGFIYEQLHKQHKAILEHYSPYRDLGFERSDNMPSKKF